jgi:hypothetical protein
LVQLPGLSHCLFGWVESRGAIQVENMEYWPKVDWLCDMYPDPRAQSCL